MQIPEDALELSDQVNSQVKCVEFLVNLDSQGVSGFWIAATMKRNFYRCRLKQLRKLRLIQNHWERAQQEYVVDERAARKTEDFVAKATGN